MIRKILLFGSTGMLGSYIYDYFRRLSDIEIIKIDYRVANKTLANLENILSENGIDEHTCIINYFLPFWHNPRKHWIVVN